MRAILFGLLLGAGLATAATAQTISGRYEVQGTNPNGSGYSGTADITQTSASTCRIAWHVGTEWRGICMLSGDVFAAAYHSDNTSGLLIYRRRGDGSLSGVWTVGGGGDGTETLIPMR
jgi:hypothetical protein